jgi:GNAT superfamily N-acetyltransferase
MKNPPPRGLAMAASEPETPVAGRKMDGADHSTPIPPALIGTGAPPINPPKKVTVAVPPATVANDSALVSRIASLVNEVYATTEEGLFGPNYRRTDDNEIRRFIRAAELALAWHDDDLPTADSIIGCIRFFAVSPTTADFGVLACDPAHRGQRIGHRLVQFAEEQSRARGMKTMECQLLVSTEFDHAFKVRLEEWYTRLGYRMVRTEEFSKDHYQLSAHCITPAKLKVFEKSLGR